MKINAKEMFEAIGYHQVVIDPKYCSYSFDDGGYIKSIEFIGIKKEIRLHDLETYNDNKSQDVFVLDEYELKAINKQCEELGWIEEEKNEIKQETNFDHYKDRILDCCIDNLAVVKGIPKSCSKIDCNECDFLTIKKECCEIAKDWFKQPCRKPTFKINQFEYDLLQSCSQGYSPKYQFKNINSLTEMRKNGYFKCINRDETIEEILANCEVVV